MSPLTYRSAAAVAVADGLDTVLGDRVLRPGADGYDATLAGFNRILDGARPAAVVAARDSGDVVRTVRAAAGAGVPVGVQATGHGAAVPPDDGLLISTAGMDGVRVDPDRRTARVRAGTRWSEVITEAARSGLAPLNGAAPSVGVVSYTLGGGHGPLGRSYGWAADRVRSLDVVTADGMERHVTPEADPELFWGLRGGRGNFGVVTAAEFELFDVPRLYGGALFLPGSSAPEALRTWRDWTRSVPDAMQSGIGLLRMPDEDGLPDEIRGRFLVHLRIAFNGPAEEGRRWVRPLREIAEPVLDRVRDMPYTDVASINMDPTEPGVYYERSARLTDLDDGAVDVLVDMLDELEASPRPVVELRHLGGALARPPAVPNAVPFRDAGYSLFTGGPVRDAERVEVRDFQRRLVDAMAAWRIGGPFLSFISALENTPEHLRSAYDPDTYARLVALKDARDPANIFRFTHNVPPTAAAC